MTRKALAALALSLAAVALAGPGTGQAATKAKTLGPAPMNYDCLAWSDPERGCYYGIIGGIDYAISPHIARVGEKLVGTSTGFGGDSWSWYHPPGVSVDECNPNGGPPGPHNGTCVYTATAPTGGWRPGPEAGGHNAASSVFFGSAIHCCTIGTYIAGDYVAILGPDEYSIDGTVVDAEGDPVKSGNVFIAGETSAGKAVDSFTEIDDTGYYNAQFEKGTYTVSGFSGGEALCLADVRSQCIEHRKVSPSSSVNFRIDGYAEIAGKVTNLSNEPVKNVVVLVTDASTGKPVADGDTDRFGEYQIDIDDSGTYRVVPVLGGSVFNPDHRVVGAETGKEVTADFQVYDPLKVEIESGFVRGAGNDFTTRLTITNKSTTATVTDLAPVNAFGVRVAENAYPPERRGRVTAKQLTPLGRTQPSRLAPGESWSADVRFSAEAAGLVGLRAKFSGKVEVNGEKKDITDTHDATVDIEEPKEKDEKRERTSLAAQAIDLYLEQMAEKFHQIEAREARERYKSLRKHLTAEQEKMWFGSTEGLKISKGERAMAMAMGIAPESVAIATPRGRGKDLTQVDLAAIYRGQRAQHDRKAAFAYFDTLSGAAGAVYGAGANEWRYWSQVADPEGQTQISNDIALYFQMQGQGAQENSAAFVKALIADGPEIKQSLGESQAALGNALAATNKAMEQAVARNEVKEHQFNARLADYMAEGNYEAAMNMTSGKDSAVASAVSIAVAEDLMLGGAIKVGGKVIKGGKAALAEVTEAINLARKGGPRAVAEATEVGSKGRAGLPTFFDDLPEDSRVAIGMDRLRNMGGISGRDASIARRNVAEVNKQLRERFGPDATADFYLRPVNPFEVVGSMAKVEVVGVKSVNPIDTLLGASPKSLGQPGIFRPRPPESLPNWSKYTEADKVEIAERFDVRMTEYAERHGTPKPGGKMEKMVKAIDERVQIKVDGQYADQARVYDLELDSKVVDGTEILSYKHLSINGDVLTDKVRPIGVDLDDFMWGDGKGGRLPPEMEDFADELMDRLGREAAVAEGYSEPFHGQTLRRMEKSDMSVAAFPSFAHYGLRHLPEKEARIVAKEIAERFNKAFPDKPPITADDVLKEVNGRFSRKAIKVTENDVIYGDPGIRFADP